MELQLIKGKFEKEEALDILHQMIQIKIKFHERKINSESSEEEIKMRETRIKQLQNELASARAHIMQKEDNCSLLANLVID